MALLTKSRARDASNLDEDDIVALDQVPPFSFHPMNASWLAPSRTRHV